MIKCNSNPLRKELTALQIAAVSYLSKKKVDTEIIGVPDHQRYGTSKERFRRVFVGRYVCSSTASSDSSTRAHAHTHHTRAHTPPHRREFLARGFLRRKGYTQ